MATRHLVVVAILAVALLAGCAAGPMTKREGGALGGGALGAGTGALIGHAVGHTAGGAAIGGALGVLGGVLLGDQLQAMDQRSERLEGEIHQQRHEIARLKKRLRDQDPELDYERY